MEVCEKLLNDDPESINVRGAQQRTPLHRAVGKGHNHIVNLLIEKKADFSIVDGGGLTALHWAALFGLVDTGRLLVRAHPECINSQTKSGETPLHLSAEKGNTEFVLFLMESKANIEVKDMGANGGQTAYDAAKAAGHKECMQLLKPVGANACCVMS